VRSLADDGGAPRAAAAADRLLCGTEALARQLAAQAAALMVIPHEPDGL
jgi:hypothetical protein